MRKKIYWIEGDGIGPEIWRAARPVIDNSLRAPDQEQVSRIRNRLLQKTQKLLAKSPRYRVEKN